jgi:thioredoxin reductase
MQKKDVIIIGGSFAGLAAALYLARARREVLVLDSGEPRNRYSAHSHGVFALDGQPGVDLIKTARSQLLAYPTAKFLTKRVTQVTKNGRLFEVETEDEEHFESRRLILATGLVDILPEIPGLQERWGKSVFHCPYCDGYEIGGGPIGVIATLPLSVHFAKLITDWGDVTLFVNGAINLDHGSRESLTKKGVRIEERPIARLESLPGGLDQVILDDGSTIGVKAIFVGTLFRMAAPFAKDLDCALSESPRGQIVRTDESKMTTVPGVYAAGDVSRLTHSIPFATSDGVTAGVSAHQSLVAEEEDIQRSTEGRN